VPDEPDEAQKPDDDPAPSRGLTALERWLASIIGLAGGGRRSWKPDDKRRGRLDLYLLGGGGSDGSPASISDGCIWQLIAFGSRKM